MPYDYRSPDQVLQFFPEGVALDMIEELHVTPYLSSCSTFECGVCGRDGFTSQAEAGRHESACIEGRKNRGLIRRFYGKRYKGKNLGIWDLQIESIEYDSEVEE